MDFISEAATDFQLLDSTELGRAQKVVLGLYRVSGPPEMRTQRGCHSVNALTPRKALRLPRGPCLGSEASLSYPDSNLSSPISGGEERDRRRCFVNCSLMGEAPPQVCGTIRVGIANKRNLFF